VSRHDSTRAESLTVPGAAYRYRIFGWGLLSELALPDLPPGDAADSIDVTFRLGEAPSFDDPVQLGALVAYRRDGCVRIEIPGVAAYLVQRGREVVIEPQMALDAPDIRVFLLGSVVGILCHQRGELPLHGSCVEVDGQAVVLSGLSGTGKSTLAAAMVAGGARLLADDVAVAMRVDGGGFRIMPAFPRQKLWRDALTALDLLAGRRVRSSGDAEKFEHAIDDRFCPDPRPLALVCHLSRGLDAAAEPLLHTNGFEALQAVNEAVYRLGIGQAVNGQQMFAAVAALAKSVPQLRLPVPDDLNALSSFAAELPTLLRRYGGF
jgi:hypothetical protein